MTGVRRLHRDHGVDDEQDDPDANAFARPVRGADMAVQFVTRIVERTLAELADGIEAAIPRLITGLVFGIVAYIAIRLLLTVLGAALRRYYTERQALVAQLFVTIVGLFLWFGAALAFLKIVGFGDIAASLGTAVGFIALGISYALSEMIEDTVAGVYLLRDPDFEVGDRVEVDGTEGIVSAIELRKSRFTLDNGDTTILANRDVEAEWTKRAEVRSEPPGSE
ncbi:MAG: small-conductance mechanosensitive channel [Natronomonas sp.]|jgi:small-conductance mechanosensitive channel